MSQLDERKTIHAEIPEMRHSHREAEVGVDWLRRKMDERDLQIWEFLNFLRGSLLLQAILCHLCLSSLVCFQRYYSRRCCLICKTAVLLFQRDLEPRHVEGLRCRINANFSDCSREGHARWRAFRVALLHSHDSRSRNRKRPEPWEKNLGWHHTGKHGPSGRTDNPRRSLKDHRLRFCWIEEKVGHGLNFRSKVIGTEVWNTGRRRKSWRWTRFAGIRPRGLMFNIWGRKCFFSLLSSINFL